VQLHILGALAQFERGRLRERVLAGLARAKREGDVWVGVGPRRCLRARRAA
jgi:DNA invertase Pin-like site-specific DNA recombinase